MDTNQLPIVKAECTHSGQHHAYGDSETVYEIHTENNQEVASEALLPYCFSLCHRKSIQTRDEWRKACGDMGKHFAGYYTLTRTNYGYRFSFVQPYTD